MQGRYDKLKSKTFELIYGLVLYFFRFYQPFYDIIRKTFIAIEFEPGVKLDLNNQLVKENHLDF